MSKYDKFIEEGKDTLKDLANKWKNLIEVIKNKENEKWQLEKEESSLINEIRELEEKLEILKKAPKKTLKINVFLTLIIALVVAACVIPTNMYLVTDELSFMDVFLGISLPFNIWMIGGSSILTVWAWYMTTGDVRKIKKEYTIDTLTEKIQRKKEQKESRENRVNNLSKELKALYEEKEDLRSMILSLNANVSELESNRIAAIESLVPNIEGALDESFAEVYGEESPLDVMTRSRVKEGNKKVINYGS